jgi:hypothetical protein
MKASKMATVVTTFAVILFMINHQFVNATMARIAGSNDVGVELPSHVVFLFKLDHFFIDYFYVLIPFLWIVTCVLWALLRGCLRLLKSIKVVGIQPLELK